MKPTAAPPIFPFTDHRTMAQVMRDEALREFLRLPPKMRKGRTAGQMK